MNYKVQNDFSNKIALITGAASGIGKAIAEFLSSVHCHVIICDINKDGAAEVSEKIESSGGSSTVFAIDIKDLQQIDDLVSKCKSDFGKIDILINSAGITIIGKSMLLFEEQEWDNILDINLKGTFFLTQKTAQLMMDNKWGRIINIASMSSVIVNKNSYGCSGVYCISKAGLAMLTKAFASDLAEHNITVNAISPGYIRTPLSESFWADPVNSKEKTDKIPLRRPGVPEDLLGCVHYLISDNSAYMTGANILIDGGYTIW